MSNGGACRHQLREGTFSFERTTGEGGHGWCVSRRQSLDKKSKKDGQKTTRRCLERAGVRVLTLTRSPDERRNRVYSSRRLPCLALDKQATKQTRRASI